MNNNNGQNSYFERDCRARRTADSNAAMGKRFEDIKKRYATTGVESTSTFAILKGNGGGGGGVTPGGVNCQPQTIEKDYKELPTPASTFADMIACKRELFFKQQQSAPSLNNNNQVAPSTSPSPYYYPPTDHRAGDMPILSSTSSSTLHSNNSKSGSGAAYDYGDRDKPLSSYIAGGAGAGRFSSSKPSFRTPHAQPSDAAAGHPAEDEQLSSPPVVILPASVVSTNGSGGAGVGARHVTGIQNGGAPGLATSTCVVERCIGFANLPNQFYRRAVKRGFEFTLMVVGESGMGKSTLINSLFLSDIYSDEHPGPSQRHKKTVDVETSKQLLVENGVQLSLTIVDTPGFGDSVDNSECWQKILDHIEDKYEEYLNAESRVNRVTVPDSRIHCCLYFIAPSGHGLKSLDIEFMKMLHDKVNILPLISKADTMMPEEIAKFKKRIMSEIKQHNINIYEFPLLDDPEDNKRNKELRERVPFAVMGSNSIYDVNNRKVRGRKYPWGIAEVENPDHCDFLALRDMLIRRHMQHMKDVTSSTLYESFRRQKLSGGNPNKITADNPMAQLEDERREQEENLRKIEQEMEQVFAAKVREKEQKIKESKLELEKRYEQMKKTLDEQMRELDERRRNFEQERQAWEGGSGGTTLGSAPSHTSSAVSLNNNGSLNNGCTTDYGSSNGSSGHTAHNGGGGGGVSSSLQSLASSKKGHIYNDASIKEVYDEKEKKKEKKRFF